MSLKNKIINNTIINSVFSFLNSAVGFFLVPFMVSQVGLKEFGLVGICNIFSLSGYLQLLDLGLQTSIIKYAAEYHSKRQFDKLCFLFNSTLFSLMSLSLVVIAVAFLLLNFFVYDLFSIPLDYTSRIYLAFSLMFITYLYDFPNLVFSGVIEGLQKFSIVKGIQFIYTVIFAGLVTVFLLLGKDFLFIIVAMTIAGLVRAVLNGIFCFKLIPQLKIGFKFFSWDILKEIKGMTKFLMISKISGFIHGRSDRLIISIFLGPVYIAAYDIVLKLTQFLKTLMGFGYAVIIPSASAIYSTHGKDKIRQLFLKGWRINMIVYFPIVTGAIVLSGPFLKVWMGDDFLYLEHLQQVFIAQHLIALTVSFSSVILTGINKRVDQLSYITVFGCLLKLAIVLFLVKDYKLWGVATGLIVSMIAPVPVAVWIIVKEFEVSVFEFLKEVFKPLAMVVFPAVAFWVFNSFVDISNFYVLIPVGVTWCGLFWLALYFIVMDQETKKLIQELLQKVFRLRLRRAS